MLEEYYFNVYETEMISGEIKRAVHFLEKSSKGTGFYSEVSKILLDAIKNHKEPEFVGDQIMKLDGDQSIKKAIILRFIYSYNRYDVNFPFYDAKRCNDL
jgi:hypothetical protein